MGERSNFLISDGWEGTVKGSIRPGLPHAAAASILVLLLLIGSLSVVAAATAGVGTGISLSKDPSVVGKPGVDISGSGIGYFTENAGQWAPGIEFVAFGFRVATVPEPSTAVLLILGCATLVWWRKKFR